MIFKENRISAFNKIKFALWNAQSLQKKSGLVCDIISSNRLDIFAITETWLNGEGNNISLAEILNTLKDFKVIQVPRENAKGGGVALFIRKAFTTTTHSGSNYTSFEHLDVSTWKIQNASGPDLSSITVEEEQANNTDVL